MKHIFKKTIYLAGILLIIGLILLGYNYTARNLKSYAVSALEKSFGAKLSIAHMRISFPFCLQLKGVKINDTISIAKVYIYPSPASAFFKKTFIFSSIKALEPVIKIKKGRYESFGGFRQLGHTTEQFPKDSKTVFYVSRIDVENAAVIYEEEDGTRIELVKINAHLKSPYTYLIAGRLLNFSASGFIKNKDLQASLSPLHIEGWIKGDYTVKAKLEAQDVSLETMGSLYQKYLKQNVEKGSLNLNSKISISKNGLKADCFCKINDIILKDAAQKISAPLIASFILGFDFKDKAIKIDNLQTNLLSLLLSKS